jgi:hypothetical protein
MTASTAPSAPAGAPSDIAHVIGRNIAIGIAVMFSIVALGGIVVGLEPWVAVGVAVLPGIVAGPFIGGMLTVAAFRDADEDHPHP